MSWIPKAPHVVDFVQVCLIGHAMLPQKFYLTVDQCFKFKRSCVCGANAPPVTALILDSISDLPSYVSRDAYWFSSVLWRFFPGSPVSPIHKKSILYSSLVINTAPGLLSIGYYRTSQSHVRNRTIFCRDEIRFWWTSTKVIPSENTTFSRTRVYVMSWKRLGWRPPKPTSSRRCKC